MKHKPNGKARWFLQTPAILTAVVALVLVAAAVSSGLNWTWLGLASNKDAVSSLGGIVTMLVAVIGGVIAYIRFFWGRTLVRRANIQMRAVLIPEPCGTGLLHSVFVDVSNVGTLSLDDFDVTVCGDSMLTDGTASPTTNLGRIQGSLASAPGRTTVGGSNAESIDAGESYTFLFQAVQPATVALVTYRATLKLPSGIWWDQFLVQENKLPAATQPSRSSIRGGSVPQQAGKPVAAVQDPRSRSEGRSPSTAP
jgi:hypothetical protein